MQARDLDSDLEVLENLYGEAFSAMEAEDWSAVEDTMQRSASMLRQVFSNNVLSRLSGAEAEKLSTRGQDLLKKHQRLRDALALVRDAIDREMQGMGTRTRAHHAYLKSR